MSTLFFSSVSHTELLRFPAYLHCPAQTLTFASWSPGNKEVKLISGSSSTIRPFALSSSAEPSEPQQIQGAQVQREQLSGLQEQLARPTSALCCRRCIHVSKNTDYFAALKTKCLFFWCVVLNLIFAIPKGLNDSITLWSTVLKVTICFKLIAQAYIKRPQAPEILVEFKGKSCSFAIRIETGSKRDQTFYSKAPSPQWP